MRRGFKLHGGAPDKLQLFHLPKKYGDELPKKKNWFIRLIHWILRMP